MICTPKVGLIIQQHTGVQIFITKYNGVVDEMVADF